MKFQDIIFLIETGGQIAASAAGNPLLAASASAGARLIRLGYDFYQSGQNRGEWSDAQEKYFDEEVLPIVTAQDHWIKNQPPQ